MAPGLRGYALTRRGQRPFNMPFKHQGYLAWYLGGIIFLDSSFREQPFTHTGHDLHHLQLQCITCSNFHIDMADGRRWVPTALSWLVGAF